MDRKHPSSLPKLAAAASLVLLTLTAFSPAITNGFLRCYDDSLYVTSNPMVVEGLSWSGFRWALGAQVASNWHPLTLLSHMLDVTLFGLDPRGHHLTSVILHAAAAFVLFLLLAEAAGEATGRAFFVSALFAIHPLRVESVAWIAERKDVLSVLFGLLALYLWIRWTRRPRTPIFIGALICFALSLSAKAMFVTLPLVMLFFDRWPLNRPETYGAAASRAKLLLEKSPFLAMSAATAAIALWSQQEGRSVMSVVSFPLPDRIVNAAISYLTYIRFWFWPRHMFVAPPIAVDRVNHIGAAAAFLVLAGVTWMAIRLRRDHPWLAVGWFWYLITLLPVIGLVQVGNQAWADRYTYFPTIGLAIALVWEMHQLARRAGILRGMAFASALLLPICLVLTRNQTRVWKDDKTLFTHALSREPRNWVAHDNLGVISREQGDLQGAEEHFMRSREINPFGTRALYNLAVLAVDRGEVASGAAFYEEALRQDPFFSEAHNNLGDALEKLGRLKEALDHYSRAMSLDPDDDLAPANVGRVALALGRYDEAIAAWKAVLKRHPGSAEAKFNLGRAEFLRRGGASRHPTP